MCVCVCLHVCVHVCVFAQMVHGGVMLLGGSLTFAALYALWRQSERITSVCSSAAHLALRFGRSTFGGRILVAVIEKLAS